MCVILHCVEEKRPKCYFAIASIKGRRF